MIIDYRKSFLKKERSYLDIAPEARFATWFSKEQQFIYPVEVFGGDMWDVEKVKVLIELLQESIGIVKQSDVDRYNGFLEKEREKRYYSPPQKTERTKRKGFVYLMKAENGVYKVGFSIDPNRRIKEIQKNTPFKLEILHSLETVDTVLLERHFHEYFNINRASGEWFNLTPDQVAYFVNYEEC